VIRSRFAILVLVASCASHGTAPSAAVPEPGHILFIGNSLTYVNDLPGIVQALADSAGATHLVVETVAFPDFALVDHWNAGNALLEIRKGGWELVVLQQGPSSVEVNRDSLRMFVRRFGSVIATRGGRPALYSVWPTTDRRQDFARAIESYQLATNDVSGLLFPVASAWLAAWRRDPALQLYSPDGLHPSVAGSYLAALVMYARIAGRSPVGLPGTLRLASGHMIAIEPGIVRQLQDAAAEVAALQ
jgi:hypothetical protein